MKTDIDGVVEREKEYEEKFKEDKPVDADDPEVIEEEKQVGEKLRQLIEIVEVCLTSNQ